MGEVVQQLTNLHDAVVPKDDAARVPKRLHFHFLEKVPSSNPKLSDMPLRKALAELSGIEFVDKKPSIWVRIAQLEKLARSPTSIYAFKTVSAPVLSRFSVADTVFRS
jgi:hypothetical protein